MASARSGNTGRCHILLVDDDVMFLTITAKMLEEKGYRVTAHSRASTALAEISADPHSLNLVVTGRFLPEFSGIALAMKIKTLRPDLPVVLYTGFLDPNTQCKFSNAGIVACLLKPVFKNEMAEAISRIIG